MSFRFKVADGTVEQAVRRVARSQIEAAIAAIDDTRADRAERVHDVRKRCKKLRSLVRLVRGAFPDASAQNRRFRDAARQLSGLRDADVMIATLDHLCARAPGRVDSSQLKEIRSRFVARQAAPGTAAEAADEGLSAVRSTMVEALSAAEVWRLKADGAGALRDGLEATFRRGASALKDARKKPTDKRLHELRKRVKDQHYQVRLLREAWPATMNALGAELGRLGDLLGEEHDLAVFQAELKGLVKDGVDDRTASELRDLAAERRAELQSVALPLAARVFGGDPKAAAARLADLWDAWLEAPDTTDPASRAETGREDRGEEIERKFLVSGDGWRSDVVKTHAIRQGYLARTDRLSLRVRITDEDRAQLTAKTAEPGRSRAEIEFAIPVGKAKALMELAEGRIVEKRRHLVRVDGRTVEVDEFQAPRGGLVLAEVELHAPDDPVPDAAWLGREVTDDPAYYSAQIAGSRGPDTARLLPS